MPVTAILVDPAWLADRLTDADIRLVDCRWRGDGTSREIFLAGHLPGAVRVDWSVDLRTSGPVPRGIPDPESFAALMSRLGIGNDTLVVAYADEDYSGAARLWWSLRYHGHERVVLLDGGLDRWIAEGRPTTLVVPNPDPTRFVPSVQPALRVNADEVRAALGRRDVAFVDTRTVEQFQALAVWSPLGNVFPGPGETAVEVDQVLIAPGRIPGAIHLNSSLNLDPADSWRYRSPAELRARFEAAGLRADQRIVTYCGVGISASLGLVALTLAGYPNVALYDASWEEWGSDPNTPKEYDQPNP